MSAEKIADASFTPWYSYKGGEYNGNLPAFFDTSKWKWANESEKSFSVYRTEVENFLSAKNNILEPYFNSSLVSANGKWEVENFYFWGRDVKKNCDACPQVHQLLKSIPGMVSAGISRLSPQTEIHPHHGDTNMIMRCHFGLSIPAGLPDCGLEVKNEKRHWENGKWLAFCDAYEHAAWNRTNQFRYILIVDVVLPEFVNQKKDIAANVRSLLLLQKRLEKSPWMKKLPGIILAVMRRWYKYVN